MRRWAGNGDGGTRRPTTSVPTALSAHGCHRNRDTSQGGAQRPPAAEALDHAAVSALHPTPIEFKLLGVLLENRRRLLSVGKVNRLRDLAIVAAE